MSNVSLLCIWHFTDVFQSWCGDCGCSQDLSYCRVRLDGAGQVCLVWVCEQFTYMYTVQLTSFIWLFIMQSTASETVCLCNICLLQCITWMAGWVLLGGGGDRWGFFFHWSLLMPYLLLLPTDMWLSASTVVSSSAAGSTGMETLSQNRRLSRQKTSMYGLRWGVCRFMSLCCKFHVLNNIVSMAVTVILSELEG